MRKSLFEYAILWHPTEKQISDGESSKVLVEKTTVLAKDNQTAARMAAMKIPQEYAEQLDQVEVIVRPF